MTSSKTLTSTQQQLLLTTLKARFQRHPYRHPQLKWEMVETRLLTSPTKLWSINEMESTGGEPDVVIFNTGVNNFTYCDLSPESPVGRRSLCYDQAALNSRKEHKPKDSAQHMAETMGIKLLTQEDYQYLQTVENLDTKTSSWLLTPAKIRSLGGAIFADRRYDHVFIYHNGAESYYAARGFRGMLTL